MKSCAPTKKKERTHARVRVYRYILFSNAYKSCVNFFGCFPRQRFFFFYILKIGKMSFTTDQCVCCTHKRNSFLYINYELIRFIAPPKRTSASFTICNREIAKYPTRRGDWNRGRERKREVEETKATTKKWVKKNDSELYFNNSKRGTNHYDLLCKRIESIAPTTVIKTNNFSFFVCGQCVERRTLVCFNNCALFFKFYTCIGTTSMVQKNIFRVFFL